MATLRPNRRRKAARAQRDDLTIAIWPRWRTNPYLVDLMSGLTAVGLRVVWATPISIVRHSRRCVLHLQWPDAVWSGSMRGRLWRVLSVTTLVVSARATRAPIVVTVHNNEPHDGEGAIARRIMSHIVRQARVLVVLNETAIGRLSPNVVDRKKPEQPNVVVIPHMNWRERYARPRDAPDQGEATLGDRETSCRAVWFGIIRPYKGIESFARRVTAGEFPGVHLDVLGAGASASLESANVTHVNRRVTDAEIAGALAHADLAVFPFESIENSGSVIAALATDTPVVVPRLGGMVELEREFGSGWVRLYDPPLVPDRLAELLSVPRPSGNAHGADERALWAVSDAHVRMYRSLRAAS